MLTYWEILDRCEHGPMMAENDYDMLLMKKVRKLVKKYNIKFDPNHVVNEDGEMADRIWQAAIDFVDEVGIYCLDTGRIIQISRKEILESLAGQREEIVYGDGQDVRVVKYRAIEDKKDPFIMMNPCGNPCPEEIFEPFVRSYVREDIVDSFAGPLLTTFRGRPVKSDSPFEVEGAIWNARKLREACVIEGRPGLACWNFASTAEGTDAVFASCMDQFGCIPGNGMLIGAIAEMKVDYERLKKTSLALQRGFVMESLLGPILGGYAGGAEGTALITVAHVFLGALVYRCAFHCIFPFHIHYTCTSTPDTLWANGMATQAVTRNSHMLVINAAFSQAGPCTEMCFWEYVTFALACTVSGADGLDLGAQAMNKHDEYWSPLACILGAEVAHVAARQGITRAQANKLILQILPKYSHLHEGGFSIGQKFSECYDLTTLQPTPPHQAMYEKIKAELTEMGLDFSLLDN